MDVSVDVPFAATAATMESPATATPPSISYSSILYAAGSFECYGSAAAHARNMTRALWVAVAADLVMLWPTVGTFVQRVSSSSEGRVFDLLLFKVGVWSQVPLSLATLLALVWWAMW